MTVAGPDRSCIDCRFYDDVFGQCRRHAPVLILGMFASAPAGSSSWPAVRPGDWCGEFEPVRPDDPPRDLPLPSFRAEVPAAEARA